MHRVHWDSKLEDVKVIVCGYNPEYMRSVYNLHSYDIGAYGIFESFC
jgi:hypothetical protein